MSKCNNDNFPTPPHKCAREGTEDSGLCCSECAYGSHTVQCNERTFGKDNPNARYYNNPNREADLLDRMKKAVGLCEVLHDEFKTIRNASVSLGLTWGKSTESLLAHLEVDLKYLGAEIKDLTGI